MFIKLRSFGIDLKDVGTNKGKLRIGGKLLKQKKKTEKRTAAQIDRYIDKATELRNRSKNRITIYARATSP